MNMKYLNTIVLQTISELIIDSLNLYSLQTYINGYLFVGEVVSYKCFIFKNT